MLASPTRVSTRLRALASSVLLLLASQSAPVVVDAHGYVTTPRTEFTDGVMFTKYSATMPAAFAGKFDGSPQANVDTFTKAFDAQKKTPGGFPDLRALVRDHGSECGASNPHASPKPIPSDGVVVWQNPDTGEGFVPSHTGPCEIWLDDTRVFHNDNCAGSYPSKPKAEISVDFSSCKGSCTLRFYWLALHEPTWQIYKNCIPLTGNGASASNNNNNNSNNAPATDGTTGNEAMGNGNGNDNGNGNGKVTPPDEYNHPTETPSMAPSVTSEYASPAPSRRNCNKIRPSRRTRA